MGSKILRYLRSLRFALVLIIYLILTSLIVTLIPQNQEMGYYIEYFPGLLGRIIVVLHFHRFYRSLAFLLPALLFTLNLGLCSITGFIRRIRADKLRILGSDLIHLGILILVVAGSLTLFFRKEGLVMLEPGEKIEIEGNFSLRLLSFEHLKYEDGRPKAWISRVEVEFPDGRTKTSSIEVNRPLKIGSTEILQHSYREDHHLQLLDPHGSSHLIETGTGYRENGRAIVFAGLVEEQGEARALIISRREQGEPEEERFLLKKGDPFGGYTIEEVFTSSQSGLYLVQDPGFGMVVVSVILIFLGLVLVFYRRISVKD